MEDFSDILRQPNRDLFNEMLQSTNKYSQSIDAKVKGLVTESLLMSYCLNRIKR